jgi:DNA repair exonuclease SbcCD ATPase subunit
MIFTSIYLENFGIVKNFSKQFDKQILVVSGENGQGKSTILNAIMLAVFDDYKGTLEDYINWDSTYFKVIVMFTHRGVQYESSVIYDGATDRSLKFGDKVLKGDEAKKKLKEVFDVDLLKAAMLAVEQQIDVVNTKPAERREYLKRIYDIEFKNQIANFEDAGKEHELELAKRTATQNEIQNRQYSVLVKLALPFGETDYELRKANLEIIRKTLSDIEGKLRAYQQAKSDVDSLTQQKSRLDSSLDSANTEIVSLNNSLAELPEKKRQSLEILDERKSSQFQANNKILADSNARVASVENERKDIFLERLPVFNADEYTQVSQELYTKKSKLTDLQNAKDVCPTCGQSISSPDHIEKRNIEIAELNQNIADLTNRFTNLSSAKKNREDAESRNKQKTDRKNYLDNQISIEAEKQKSEVAKGQSLIDKIDSEITHLDDSIVAEEQHLKELISTKEKARDAFIDQGQDIVKRLDEARLKVIDVPNLPVDETKNKISILEQEIKSYDDVVSRNQEIEKMEQKVAEQKAQDAKQLEVLRDEIQVLNKLIGDVKASIKILKTEFPVYVISRVVKDIEKSMNDFLRKTYGGRYRIEIEDKKNALRILYGPKKKDVSVSASGYEKQIFSSAFRLAICKAVGNKSLVLDEVDSAASDKNSAVLFQTLGELVGQGIDQMICITHKSSTLNLLESDFDAEVITFDDGVAA